MKMRICWQSTCARYFISCDKNRRYCSPECRKQAISERKRRYHAENADAIGANGQHGLRRTNEDKRRAVLKAYQLDSSLSDREIARRARVSHGLANYVLAGLRSNPSLSKFDSGGNETLPLSESNGEAESAAVPDSDWYAPGETAESTRTPWGDEPDAAPAATAEPAASSSTTPASTISVSPAGSSPEQTEAPLIADTTRPAPDVRIDARGRKMNVSRIGRRQTRAPAWSVDALGIPLTQATAPAFLTALEMDGIVRLLKEAQTRIAAIAGASGAELLRTNALRCEKQGEGERWRSPDVANAIKELQHWRPYTICPCCKGETKSECKVCLGLPYIIKAMFERCPEHLPYIIKAMFERCPEQLQEKVMAMASPAES